MKDHPRPDVMSTFFLALVFCASTALAQGSTSPSSPDDPLPAVVPELEERRRAYDREYESLREARRMQIEIGRPADPNTDPLEWLGDPVMNLDSGLGYSSLQAAINAATAGDTLRVVADLTEGPVTVDRDLFLEGSQTVRAAQDTGSSGDARGWFLVNSGVALVVRDLTFDGNGFAVYQGFRHRGFGLFQGTAFRDIRYEPSGPLYQGSAVVVFGDRVDVIDSRFEQIGRVGVLFFGGSVAGAVYHGNAYTGKGDGDFLDYAVEINGGAYARVSESFVSDCRGIASADGSESAAVQATTFSGPGTVAEIFSNSFTDNTYGVAVGVPGSGDSTAATVERNRLSGNVRGIRTASSVAVPAENNWWGCNDGPGTPDCDSSDVVDAGSVDTDPWLILDLSALPWIKPHGNSPLLARLTENSDGVDTSSLGTVPDGIPGRFAPGTLGKVLPPDAVTIDGELHSRYLADDVESGTTLVNVTVDNETVEQAIVIEEGFFCDDFESGDFTLWGGLGP